MRSSFEGPTQMFRMTASVVSTFLNSHLTQRLSQYLIRKEKYFSRIASVVYTNDKTPRNILKEVCFSSFTAWKIYNLQRTMQYGGTSI